MEITYPILDLGGLNIVNVSLFHSTVVSVTE
jgi:hypothetical protein